MPALELASNGQTVLATNVEVTWGDLGLRLGELYLLPYNLTQEVRSLRLTWAGRGVAFQVSTDNGKTWESVANGQATNLRNPGRSLLVRGLLTIDDTTVLDGYHLEVNPAKYSLFTGKTLEESTGLVYFGGRWYDPEFGRFITVDPAEDGENWYGYCGGNPINYVDPDGRFSYPAQPLWLLAGPFVYAWDLLKGLCGLSQALMPYPYLPQPVNSIIVSINMARAVIKNPQCVLDFAGKIGYGLIEDIVDTIKNFNKVVLGKPTDAEVRSYGKSLTGTGLTVISIIKIVRAIKAAGAVSATSAASESVPKSLLQGPANTRVYLGMKNGKPVYTGITKNIARRQAQHGSRFRISEITTDPLTRRQARAIEQAIINKNPKFENIINSISKNRSWYNDAVQWGESWLKQNGFEYLFQ